MRLDIWSIRLGRLAWLFASFVFAIQAHVVASLPDEPLALKKNALVGMLESIRPSVLVLHSTVGPTGFDVARNHPGLVIGIVAIEATGYLTDPHDVERHFTTQPFVAVFRDHFESRPMQGRYDAAAQAAKLCLAASGAAELIHVPSIGVQGHSHLLMQDCISALIVRLIVDTLPTVPLSRESSE